MKIKNNFFIASAFIMGLASCSSEVPFSPDPEADGVGRILTSSLAVTVKTDESLSRSDNSLPDVGKFTVDFVNAVNENADPESYEYAKMPEVVSLPVGKYRVEAHYGPNYGNNKTAAFDAPYYKGESPEFEVQRDRIVDNLDPIVCKLANVKVSITFDNELKSQMSSDSKVTVTVCDGDELEFDESTEETPGYFAFKEGSSTLVATFNGTVDGDETFETKTYNNIKAGSYYQITFRLHKVDPNEPGNINPGEEGNEIKVDASVITEGNAGTGGENVDPDGGEEFLDDDRYPKEDPVGPGPDDPTPDDPQLDNGPVITAKAPITLEGPNTYVEGMTCELVVESKTGITDFIVDILSETLTAEELQGVGLDSHLDLINPGSLEGALSGLGFPIKDQVKDQKKVDFSITNFLPMLAALGPGEHTFRLSVTDGSGTIERDLIIVVQ